MQHKQQFRGERSIMEQTEKSANQKVNSAEQEAVCMFRWHTASTCCVGTATASVLRLTGGEVVRLDDLGPFVADYRTKSTAVSVRDRN